MCKARPCHKEDKPCRYVHNVLHTLSILFDEISTFQLITNSLYLSDPFNRYIFTKLSIDFKGSGVQKIKAICEKLDVEIFVEKYTFTNIHIVIGLLFQDRLAYFSTQKLSFTQMKVTDQLNVTCILHNTRGVVVA